MFPNNPYSGGSFRDRWNSLSPTQQIFVGLAGLLLLYGLLSGSGIFRSFTDPMRLAAMGLIIFVAFPVHEFAHAAAAVKLGDDTPLYQGRYTLNPMVHIDPLGAILILFTGFGWAKPVQWNPGNVNIDPKLASIIVSLAGPVSNLLMAILALIVWSTFLPQGSGLDDLIFFFVYINVLLFVFNLIPVPPLDGSHILFALLPDDLYQLRAVLSQYGMLLLMVLIMTGGTIVTGPTRAIMDVLTTIFM